MTKYIIFIAVFTLFHVCFSLLDGNLTSELDDCKTMFGGDIKNLLCNGKPDIKKLATTVNKLINY